ncbi:MAG TPA: LamG-like jellyroll fold domain-containing protein [Kofleriaceae bacterium]|nr:LamG-like jellyroll fold domain-containing protein [Kofleriaceae bacterium]
MRASCCALALCACGRLDFAARGDATAVDAVPTGLVHRWTLDEPPGTTTASDMVGGLTATLVAPAAFTTAGHDGDGLASNTGGYASVATAPAEVIGVPALTLSAWIQRSAPSKIEQVGQELNAQAANSYDISIQAWNDGLVYFCLGTDGQCATTPTGNDTSWHLLALVFDGSGTSDATRLVGYVDGQPQALAFQSTEPIESLSPAMAARFDLGAVTDNEGQDTGTIDDVRIYDRALAPAEVTALYTGP